MIRITNLQGRVRLAFAIARIVRVRIAFASARITRVCADEFS